MTEILSLGQAIATELGVSALSGLVADTDNIEAQKILRMIERTCRQLAVRYDWTRLRREQVITTVAAAEQPGALPSDFLRMVQESAFNRTQRTKVTGPLSVEEWQFRQASITTSVYDEIYIRGTSLFIHPTPPAGETIAFEYITKNIATGDDGDGNTVEKAAFTDDGDEPFFDDELVILGGLWRFRKSEGTDYAEEMREYEMRLADVFKMDGGRRILDMNQGSGIARYPYPPKVPETLVFE